jgi:hypothetical protein
MNFIMVGNRVFFNHNQEVEVLCIMKNHIEVCRIVNGKPDEGRLFEVDIERLTGIPLTDSYLMQRGVPIDGSANERWIFLTNQAYIIIKDETDAYLRQGDNNLPLNFKFWHQIQNLYRCIMHEELITQK